MKIEEHGELTSFETLPTETRFYFSVIWFEGGFWCPGPAGEDKERVISSARNYKNASTARIYSARLPVKPIIER